MSKLVRLKLQHPLTVIQEVKGIVAIALANPREIAIETPWTVLASFVVGIAPLLLSNYNPIIFSIAIIICLVGIGIEANKYKIYTENALPIPVVINIANPADSLDALNSMPVSLAIAVGMTTQHFWNIQLTNYDGKTGTYQDLIKMNEITYRD